MNKIHIIIALLILLSFSLNAQIRDKITLNKTNYNYKIEKINTEKGVKYNFNFYYEVRNFVIDSISKSNTAYLKKISADYETYNDVLLQPDSTSIKQMILSFLKVATKEYNHLAKKTKPSNTIPLYIYAGDTIELDTIIESAWKTKVESSKKDIIKASEVIKWRIDNFPAVIGVNNFEKDINNEKPIGEIIINVDNIKIYSHSKAILLRKIPLLYKHYNNNNTDPINTSIKNNTLNAKISSPDLLYVNYEIINYIYEYLKANKKTKKDKTNQELTIDIKFIKEVKVFRRKLKRLKNKKHKKCIRYNCEKIYDTITISKNKLTGGVIVFEHSTIKYINIKLNNNTTYYSTYSIPLKSQASITNNFEYHLYNRYAAKNRKLSFIKLGDVLTYDFRPQNYTDDFSPKDNTLLFETDKDTTISVEKQSMSSIFDIRLYSDLTGLFGNEPAGIIQTEALAHFKVNTNWPNKTSIKFFNYFEPGFNYASFKDEHSTLEITDYKWGTDTSVKVDVFNLQRYSNFNTTLKINIVNIGLKRLSSTLDVNIFGSILNTKTSYNIIDSTTINLGSLNDTTIATSVETVRKNLYSTTYGIDLNWRTMQLSYFGVDVSLKLYGLKLINIGSDYELVNYNSVNNSGSNNYNIYTTFIFLYNPSITLFYTPKKGGAGSLFFRASYYGGFEKNINSYYFVQFGYSLSVNDLVNKTKK